MINRFFYDNRLLYRVFRHLMFFLVTVSVFSVIHYVQSSEILFVSSFSITMFNAIFFFGYAYITIFLLIPELLIKGRWIWFILLFSLVGIAISALKLVFSKDIYYAFIAPENIQRQGMVSLRFIFVNAKDMTFIVALFCIAKYLKDYLYIETARKKLERENREAQARLLQSQFDPHFLFNTINNLYALSLLNHEKTTEIIHRIKTVLEYIFEDSQKDLVPLDREIALTDNYIQLEKLRYGKRLNTVFSVRGDTSSVKIPPMSLFILVENCFKHGSSLDAGNPWIEIALSVEKGKLYFSSKNSKPETVIKKENTEYEKGGLQNLRKRLDLIYSGNGYSMQIVDKRHTFCVTLEIHLNKADVSNHTYR